MYKKWNADILLKFCQILTERRLRYIQFFGSFCNVLFSDYSQYIVQGLLDDAPKIKDGYLEVPDRPGLGVTLNMDRVMEANKLYNQMPSHDRNDAMAMQYLIPNWKYDSKKPCLVR